MELSCCCGDFEWLRDDSLVLHIFTFLGNLLDLLRLRAVCKSWCFAVGSPHFLKLYKPSFPWCVFRVRTEVPDGRPVHDYKMKLRNHAELWIPGTSGENCEYAIGPRKCGVPLGPEGSCFVGLCSAGGLVCGRLMERRFLFILSVGNPITNVWKTLPPAPVREKFHLPPSLTCIHMQTTPTSLTSTQTSCYKIVVLYRLFKPGADDRILVVGYDSRTGVWDIGPKFVPSTLAASPLVGDAIYHYSCPLHTGYDPETKTWSCCNIQFKNLHLEGDAGNEWEGWLPGWSRLFKYKGEYYLLAELELNEELCSSNLGISIWKLQQDLNSWLLISRILWKHLGFPTSEHRDIVTDHKVDVVEDTVVVSSFYKRNTYGNFHRYAYNMVTKAWTPAYTHLRRLADFEGCYTFLPSLTAQP